MKKDLLKELALAKIDDANLLFSHKRYSNAYYLYGYGVELALKAVVAGQFRAGEIPEKKLVLGIYTHDYEQLIYWAGLKDELKQARKDKWFDLNWKVVRDWSEQSRYRKTHVLAANVMKASIENPDTGVMQWVQLHW